MTRFSGAGRMRQVERMVKQRWRPRGESRESLVDALAQERQVAHVSKTFLYDPKHADLAQEIRRLREIPMQPLAVSASPTGKSEEAKTAQIACLKERVHQLERRVRDLQQENELLYGKLAAR